MLCYYQAPELEQSLYFFTPAQRDVLQPVIDYPLPILPSTNSEAYMDNDAIAVTKYIVNNLTFSEEEMMEGRYKYQKSISFELNGFIPASTFFPYGYVAFKNSQGMTLFPNYDFPYQISYQYDGFKTSYVLTILSNIPLLRTRRSGQMTLRGGFSHCGYQLSDVQPLRVNIIGDTTYTYDHINNFQLQVAYDEANAQVECDISFDVPINGLSGYYDASINPIIYKQIEVVFPDKRILLSDCLGGYSINNETVTYSYMSLSNDEPSIFI